MKTVFIGCGNMGSALIGGMLKNGVCRKEDICAAEISEEIAQTRERELGIRVTLDAAEAVKGADVVFLAVKPQYYEGAIGGIREHVTGTVVSIAPGFTVKKVRSLFGPGPARIIRMMPNTPVLVQEGMIGWCAEKDEETQDRPERLPVQEVIGLLSGFCRMEEVPEHLLSVVTGVSGSSPAYVFMFIEALADAAVEGGMPRAQAYRFAAQAVLGSAKMVLETGLHPGALKDMVCSPAGTTIEAVRVLERMGMRSSVMEATLACIKKAEEMGGK